MIANPEKTIKAKTPALKNKLDNKSSEKYVQRRCKIMDASIIEVNNNTIQMIFVTLKDIYDDLILKMDINTQDFAGMGFPISSMDLIEIATWLRDYNSLVVLNVPESERTITLQMLLDSIDDIENEIDEDNNSDITEEIIELVKEPEPKIIEEEKLSYTRTVKATKFGRKTV